MIQYHELQSVCPPLDVKPYRVHVYPPLLSTGTVQIYGHNTLAEARQDVDELRALGVEAIIDGYLY